ncbi:MAG: OB-fold nucleic acid binding domain-containing protein, partial [Chromatocurvus sp.]
YRFTVNARREIVYGLGAIKGLGEGPVELLLTARCSDGHFTDLFDFCARTDPRKVNRRAIEALVRAGAFDSLEVSRWILMASIDDALRAAEQNAANRDAGMLDLFGESVVTAAAAAGDPYAGFRDVRPWSDRERLTGEKETLGLYVTGHPIDEYEAEVRRMAPVRIADLRLEGKGTQRLAGLVIALRTTKTARGTMAIATVDDRSARIEVTAFAETYADCRDVLQKDTIIIAEGRLAQDDFNNGAMVMRATGIRSLAQERERLASELTLEVHGRALDDAFADFLARALGAAPGVCPVKLFYCSGGVRAPVMLGKAWQVRPTEDLLETLRERLGSANVRLGFA